MQPVPQSISRAIQKYFSQNPAVPFVAAHFASGTPNNRTTKSARRVVVSSAYTQLMIGSSSRAVLTVNLGVVEPRNDSHARLVGLLLARPLKEWR